MDDKPATVEIQRVGRSERRAPLLILLVVTGLALAVLKPWLASPEGSSASTSTTATLPSAVTLRTPAPVMVATPVPAVPPSPRPTPTLSPQQSLALAALDRRQCQSNVGWRVVTIEEAGTRHTRTLLAVTPLVLTTNASDPHIPAVTLYAERLLGIGYCVPSANGAAPDRPKPDVVVWQVPSAGPATLIRDLTPLDDGLMAAGEYYYGPPTGRTADLWAQGRYVFEILSTAKDARSHWFALDFRFTATADAALPHPAP
jgi:hypothetical protein